MRLKQIIEPSILDFASGPESFTCSSKFFLQLWKKLSWNSDVNFYNQEKYANTWEPFQSPE